jgi:hypothetical protein
MVHQHLSYLAMTTKGSVMKRRSPDFISLID